LSEEENVISGATGSSAGVEGTIISGHEDQFVRFFDANSGMSCFPFHPPSDR
jgi:striatin 1/3/4